MTKNLGKLDDLLNRFQKAVDDGKYKRIPYTQWKKLKTADKCKAKIVTDENTGEQLAQIIRKEDNKIVLEFPVRDQSFGEFLSTEILTGGIDTMPPKDNDTLKQIYTWDNNASSNYYDSLLGKIEYVPGNTATSISSNYTIGYGEQTNRIEPTIRLSDFSQVYSDKTNESITDTFVTKDEFYAALVTKEDKKPLNLEKTKENDKMKGFNFDFGPCNNNTVKMSMYGLAVKNATGTWVSYDANSKSVMDVDILNFDGAKFLYKMPVAIDSIKVGDVVIHNGYPMFVINVASNSGTLCVIDPHAGEQKDILLTKSPFGFNFATKVVNFLDNVMGTPADATNPFGNMWMLMLAGDGAANDILPFMLMNQNGSNIDPMMMYFLLGNKGDNKDMLPLVLMMNANKPAHTCHCGGDCACTDGNK